MDCRYSELLVIYTLDINAATIPGEMIGAIVKRVLCCTGSKTHQRFLLAFLQGSIWIIGALQRSHEGLRDSVCKCALGSSI